MTGNRWLLLALVSSAIFYGSLYPFSFHVTALDAAAPHHLLATWRQAPPSLGDALANLLFYIPLGFSFVQALNKKAAAGAILAVALGGGAALSLAMELLQFYDAGRDSSMSDVYLNSAGSLLGALAALAWGRQIFSDKVLAPDNSGFALLILLAWLGWRLFPYAPVIDLHKYWASLKPVVLAPSLDPYGMFRFAIMWTAVIYLAQFGLRLRNPKVVVPAAIAGVFLAKILIVDLVITLPEIIGAILAVIFFYFVLQKHVKAGTRLLAVLFMTSVLLERILPLQISLHTKPFEWIPFYGFLHGALEVNAQSFMQKLFLYGAGLFLLTAAGISLVWATALECALLLGTSIVETHLIERSGEITDALLAVLLGVIFYLLDGTQAALRGEANPHRRRIWDS